MSKALVTTSENVVLIIMIHDGTNSYETVQSSAVNKLMN